MGKILIIKDADFSQVAISKVTPDDPESGLSPLMQLFKDTVELRGRASADYEYVGNPWRASCDVFRPIDVGLNVGDVISYHLPDDIFIAHRSGAAENDLKTNYFWGTSASPSGSAVSKENGTANADPLHANWTFVLEEYNCFVLCPSSTRKTLNIDAIKNLIDSSDIYIFKNTSN